MFIENHETVTGKKYRMVLTGLSLLGVVWPGCSTLDDLQLLTNGEGVTVKAAMNIEDVRTAYYEQLDEAGEDFHWWWIRGMRVNPNELVVDDDDGHLYRVPFTVKGDGVKFGDPVQVVVDYKDVPVGVAAGIFTEGLLGGRQEHDQCVVFASRAESRPESTEGGQMDRTALCASLGLEASATDAEIMEKLTAGGVATDPVSSTGEDETPPEDDNGDDTDEGEDEEAQSGLPATVTVEASQFEQLKSDAALARDMHNRSITMENDSIMKEAVRAGKFAPSVAASVRKQLENPGTREATIKWIDELEAGVVPVAPIGSSAAGDEVEAGAAGEGLPWFTREHKRAIALSNAAEGHIQSDGKYARGTEAIQAGAN